ncbi:MAG: acyl carrier protein [Kiritimatiellae bacterium]|nr:acyl carrier protein [Kiritimatiellia bacterium]
MKEELFLANLAKILRVEPGSIKRGDLLDDMAGWDSLAVVTFLSMADSEFHARVSPMAVVNCKTVDDLMKMVDKP